MPLDHYGPTALWSPYLRAIDCQVCGYAHLDTLPSREELDAYYRDEFYHEGRPLLEQEARQQWYWRLVYRERMREFERVTDTLTVEVLRNTGRGFFSLLDWGAGCGRFTDYVCREWSFQRWQVWGYEPSIKAIEQAAYPMVIATGHPSEWHAGLYDAIHCSLVLEHVRDPVATLMQIRDLLLPGGVLCVVVPNEFNQLQKRLTERYGYSPLHKAHVNYFTPATLKRCLRRAGFEVLRTTATFPIEWFALHGLNYVKFPSTGKIAHTLRMLFEAALLTCAPGVKRQLYERWAGKGIGREIEIWARKPS